MESSNLPINVVVWAEDLKSATEIAASIINGSQNKDIWTGIYKGCTVKAFVRYPGGVVASSPEGFTDILLVSLSGSKSSFLNEAKSYINTRKGIPFIFITSSENLTDMAKEVGCEYMPISELGHDTTRGKFFESVKTLDATLKKAFDSLDLNHTGCITAEELVQASETLNHKINSEEAKSIAFSLSKDGQITFDKFKSWWLMGRGDFNTFRRLVQIEMNVGGFIKKGLQVFNNYVDKLQKEGIDSADISYTGNLNISPVDEFESGIGFNFDLAGGKDYEGIISVSPDYFKTSPITYGLEIHLKDQTSGAIIKQALEDLKVMLSNIPQVKQIFDLGLQVNVRHIGLSIFIDISLGGIMGDQVLQQMNIYNFEQLNFAGTANSSIVSGLKFEDLLKASFDELIEKICKFKLESQSQFSNTKMLVYAVFSVYEGMSQQIPSNLRNLISLIKFFGAVRNFDYEFKYDSKLLAVLAKQVAGQIGNNYMGNPGEAVFLEECSNQLVGLQGMGHGMINQFKPMIDVFLEPYKPMIKVINFNKITIFTVIPKMKMFYKFNLNVEGLTDFINQNLVS